MRDSKIVCKKRKRVQKKGKESDSESEESDNEDGKLKSLWRIRNNIYFYCDVSSAAVLKMHKIVDEIEEDAKLENKKVTQLNIYINSNGGCARSGLLLYDIVRGLSCNVTTIAHGLVASAATLLFLAGNNRLITPNSVLLIHEVSMEIDGALHTVKTDLKNALNMSSDFANIYYKHSNLSKHTIRKIMKSDLETSAKLALRYGLAHSLTK
jgi:ATP-dependent protease ClpP protease subunit